MHDPMVVAHEIRRPWPKRHHSLGPARWRFRGPFWTIAGRGFYWPSIVTIWHVEPGGRDAFTVCKHRSRWRWHVWHWRLQLPPLQALRRWALTRCAWCGGKSRRGAVVNCSHQWDGPRGRWWQGEPGLYHGGCSGIATAHQTCTCDAPILEHNDWGRCLVCSMFRAWRNPGDDPRLAEDALRATRLLKEIPAGGRDPMREGLARGLWAGVQEMRRERELREGQAR